MALPIVADDARESTFARVAHLDLVRKHRIPVKLILLGKVHGGILGDPAADVSIFLGHMTHQTITEGDNIQQEELTEPRSIADILEDAQLFAYRKVTLIT